MQAQAIGEPGHRTFRLMVESSDGRAAALWVEKEQLQALGLAVEQLLAENRLQVLALLDAVPTRIVTEADLRDVDPTLQSVRNLNTPAEYESALRDAP